jgi:hypothetical protein
MFRGEIGKGSVRLRKACMAAAAAAAAAHFKKINIFSEYTTQTEI